MLAITPTWEPSLGDPRDSSYDPVAFVRRFAAPSAVEDLRGARSAMSDADYAIATYALLATELPSLRSSVTFVADCLDLARREVALGRIERALYALCGAAAVDWQQSDKSAGSGIAAMFFEAALWELAGDHPLAVRTAARADSIWRELVPGGLVSEKNRSLIGARDCYRVVVAGNAGAEVPDAPDDAAEAEWSLFHLGWLLTIRNEYVEYKYREEFTGMIEAAIARAEAAHKPARAASWAGQLGWHCARRDSKRSYDAYIMQAEILERDDPSSARQPRRNAALEAVRMKSAELYDIAITWDLLETGQPVSEFLIGVGTKTQLLDSLGDGKKAAALAHKAIEAYERYPHGVSSLDPTRYETNIDKGWLACLYTRRIRLDTNSELDKLADARAALRLRADELRFYSALRDKAPYPDPTSNIRWLFHVMAEQSFTHAVIATVKDEVIDEVKGEFEDAVIEMVASVFGEQQEAVQQTLSVAAETFSSFSG